MCHYPFNNISVNNDLLLQYFNLVVYTFANVNKTVDNLATLCVEAVCQPAAHEPLKQNACCGTVLCIFLELY
jgi:hypothetical protein